MRMRYAVPATLAAMALSVASFAGPATAAAPKPAPAPTQTLVAQGDGWYLYVEGPSAASIRGVSGVRPMTVVDCGWVTCSVYLSRSQTHWAQYNVNALGGGLVGLGAACAIISAMSGPAAVVVAAACGAEIGILGGFLLNALNHADQSNGCLRIRYGALPTSFYDDHSGFCHDT